MLLTIFLEDLLHTVMGGGGGVGLSEIYFVNGSQWALYAAKRISRGLGQKYI